ncbi:glycosyl transferase [Methylopila jiangsuensis]|uniref:Glycosyl transferase n=1 Tax=Methylopila jiangsuensis TaxID=586230 RepID=A0A9W6JJ86_9HYPH|nr:glycosyltransferase [Methylopila jiangsuensis]MDR6286576.1 glycosyltransferase involved in cell wall biosynthesis [Methylopila jiangsuensis]GLK77084.1 glycosyl transferase [Methylopila jiangsuensis]
MLSVVIPTRNDENRLGPTLAALVPGVAEGLVRDVALADGGSTDATLEIADIAGCGVVGGFADRAGRIDAAMRRAKSGWVLLLEPGVVLAEGWRHEARSFIEAVERRGEQGRRAAVFSFGLDRFGARARAEERFVGLWGSLSGLPQPEQGLLIHKSLYQELGGMRPLPAMAEADLLRRIGRRRLVRLRALALAPATPRRPTGAKGAIGAGLLMLRVPPALVSRLYG